MQAMQGIRREGRRQRGGGEKEDAETRGHGQTESGEETPGEGTCPHHPYNAKEENEP